MPVADSKGIREVMYDKLKDERRADDDVVLICMMCTTNNAWRHGERKCSRVECVHSSS